MRTSYLAVLSLSFLATCPACHRTNDTADSARSWQCVIGKGEDPDYTTTVGCFADFEFLASEPLDASIPGAISTKTVVDRDDGDALYFQNSERYALHWDFAKKHLSGDGLPLVPELATFNATEYYDPERRFLLGAVTWYEEPDAWVYEISPYDTATSDLIAQAFYKIRDHAYFGTDLAFHPTSSAVEEVAEDLPDDIPVLTTDELYEGISYQPLNLGTTMGRLVFYTADELDDLSPSYEEVVVLEEEPTDISVVRGIITGTFQTPLSHINVLSQNRGTPNMALKGAMEHTTLRDLEDAWVELTVEASSWSIREVTQEEADAWWEENKPDPIEVTPMDVSVTELTDIDDVLDLENLDLADALAEAIPAFGGKASHFSGLRRVGQEVCPVPEAFAIPVYYYDRFMEENGFWDRVEEMLEDDSFQSSADVREEMLDALRDDMEDAPVDTELLDALTDKIESEYPDQRMRFRSSTNAEDLSGFNGAGLYDSKSGDPNDDDYPIDEALREVWASTWNTRAYEEREYYSIDHTDIGMAVLVHHSFPDEEANGVGITANIYDTSGMEPAFYINVQEGEASVVEPESGVTSDQFIYYYYTSGQPTVFLAHSSLVEDGETVLTSSETADLGDALDAIHDYFKEVYGSSDFYAMDVEFKFDDLDSGEEPELWVKQARPYPGWDSE